MMRLKLLLPTVLAFTTTIGFCASADFVGSSGSLSVDHTTVVPGDTLKSGSYSISVTEQLADRMIVRIDSTTSKNHAIFLGVPSSPTKLGGGAGAVAWGVGLNKTQTMRGFVFPNGNAVEFVYPKADAAALAKENGTAVVAVDPRSEGKVALKSLSQDELAIVNLWLLSMTTTGADSKTPGVLAKRYDGAQSTPEPVVSASIQPVYPVTPGPAVAPPVRVQSAVVAASPTVPTSPAPARTSRRRGTVVADASPAGQVSAPPVEAAKSAPQAPTQVASLEEPKMPEASARPARQNHGMTQLPHTASSLPVFWLIGLLSLLGAGLVRLGRMWMTMRAEA